MKAIFRPFRLGEQDGFVFFAALLCIAFLLLPTAMEIRFESGETSVVEIIKGICFALFVWAIFVVGSPTRFSFNSRMICVAGAAIGPLIFYRSSLRHGFWNQKGPTFDAICLYSSTGMATLAIVAANTLTFALLAEGCSHKLRVRFKEKLSRSQWFLLAAIAMVLAIFVKNLVVYFQPQSTLSMYETHLLKSMDKEAWTPRSDDLASWSQLLSHAAPLRFYLLALAMVAALVHVNSRTIRWSIFAIAAVVALALGLENSDVSVWTFLCTAALPFLAWTRQVSPSNLTERKTPTSWTCLVLLAAICATLFVSNFDLIAFANGRQASSVDSDWSGAYGFDRSASCAPC